MFFNNFRKISKRKKPLNFQPYLQKEGCSSASPGGGTTKLDLGEGDFLTTTNVPESKGRLLLFLCGPSGSWAWGEEAAESSACSSEVDSKTWLGLRRSSAAAAGVPWKQINILKLPDHTRVDDFTSMGPWFAAIIHLHSQHQKFSSFLLLSMQ